MNTADFLNSLWSSIPEDVRNVTIEGYAALLIASILIALLIAHMYNRFYDPNTTGSRIHRSFPILAPAVTTIFVTVQYSLPLSLGLLGALSIVRFRTPIKEPEEIGFILLVIACSISIATFNISFAAILYVIVFISLFIRAKWPTGMDLKGDNKHSLNILIPEGNQDQLETISEKLKTKKITHQILSIQMTEQGTSATFVLTSKKSNNQGDSIQLLSSLKHDFPTTQFDYYQG